jgi:hypothetical protein
MVQFLREFREGVVLGVGQSETCIAVSWWCDVDDVR